ncbi:hypothetical protein CHUAL_006393 [Chamberlinius hualienensis]
MERSSDGYPSTVLFSLLTSLMLVRADDVTTPAVSLTPRTLQSTSLSSCEDAGFSGAFVNDCGYCVQGVTGLPRDYGRDCSGGCGDSYVDCAGKCNGNSYIDECDGKCVESLSHIVMRSALGPSMSGVKKRDCRGLCPLGDVVGTELSNLTYQMDGCGVCVAMTPSAAALLKQTTDFIQLNKNQSSRIVLNDEIERRQLLNDQLPPSIYRDCTGTCFKPATEHLMAVNSSNTCEQCWGPMMSSMGSLDLKDDCGQCRKDHSPCLCPIDRQDLCGVCNGTNDSCVTIASAFPLVVQANTDVTIYMKGVALKNRHSTFCLLIRKDIGLDGRDEDRFPANIQEDLKITCAVNLAAGIYELRLAVVNAIDGRVMEMSKSSFPFVVYSQSAMINSLTPLKILLTDDVDNFTLTLHGQHLERLASLQCFINGSGFDRPLRVNSSEVKDSTANCTFPLPFNSFAANVTVSLDGSTTFAGPFNIRFVTPPPQVIDAFVFPEGDSLAIFFNRDIDSSVSDRKRCSDYLTSSTVDMLGENSTCVWVTKRQLLIELGPQANFNSDYIGKNSTADDNEGAMMIVFEDDLLRVNNETFTEAATNIELSFFMADEIPVAILFGPRYVPPCGQFVLDGHQSIHIQNRRATFAWSVVSGDDDSDFNNATLAPLRAAIDEANRLNTQWLILDADWLLPEIDYLFSLSIYNSRQINVTLASVANVTVTKSRNNIPLVAIQTSLASYPNALTADQSFILYSYVTMPTCQHELFSIAYNWTFSNPKFKVDLRQLNGDKYKIAAFALPVDENVTVTLRVTLNGDRNKSSEASLELLASASKIKAYVDGGFRRTVGTGSDVLMLNASKSYFPDQPLLPLMYRWECIEDGLQPCYDHDSNSLSILLLNQPISRQPVLAIPTHKLKAESTIQLTLSAISPLNPKIYSEPKTVTIIVVNGTVPIVSIESLSPLDKTITKPEMDDMVHLIPTLTEVIVTGRVQYKNELVNLEWFIEGLNFNLSSQTSKSNAANSTIETNVIIPREWLTAKGLYVIGLRAADSSGAEGITFEAFTVLPSVTGCVVNLADYEAFQMVRVTVERCVADDGSYPLSYQVHVYKGNHLISLSPVIFHQPIDIMGPPDMTDAVASGGSNIFAVQVCDALSNCHWFNSSEIKVKAATNLQATAEHAFSMANIAKLQGDYLSCLRRHVLYLEAVTPSYRYKHEMEYESQMAESFLCARMAADQQCFNSDCFQDLFTFLISIQIENGPGRDFILMEVMERAVNRMDVERIPISGIGAQEAIYILEKIYNFNQSNSDTMNRVVQVEQTLQTVLARSLQVGESSLLLNSKGRLLMALTHTMLNNSFKVNVSPNSISNETLELRFSKNMRDRYSTWECLVNSSQCRGVVAELMLYPDKHFEPITVDHNKTVSEIVKVVTLNPNNGAPIDDKTPLTLQLMANGSAMDKDLVYNCYQWNTDDNAWSTDDIDTEIINGTIFKCAFEKSNYIAIIGAPKRFSAGEIAGIVLGVIGVVALIGLVAFFFYKKARTKSIRVSVSKDPVNMEMR